MNWPQDYCTVLYGNKQPTYDELNSFQWSQGYIQCALDESDNVVKENMLKHFISTLSLPMVRRAHGFILQEMERGNVTWLQPEKVEKLIRSRNTQRIVQVPNGRVGGLENSRKLCCVSCITRELVDTKSRQNIQTKVSPISIFVLTALQTQVRNMITQSMHV